MDKKVYYCIPTYKSFDHAYDGVLAALRGTIVPHKVIVIDNSGVGTGAAHLQPLTEKFANVFIWPQTRNLGVAGAWNKFHDEIKDDYVVIANDDVAVHPHTLERLLATVEQNPKEVLFAGSGNSGNAFSLFLLLRAGYEKIGGFDTNFYPAYYEDNDYALRANLLGYTLTFASDATYDHVGSSTIKRYTPQEMEMHHNTFRRNTQYFISKWGGLPGETKYTEPFGGVI